MRIAINALSATIGGGITYLRNLVPALASLDNANVYYLFVAEEYYAEIFGRVDLGNSVKVIKIKKRSLVFRLIQEQLLLPFLIWKYKIDILFCPANITSFLAPCKKVLGILNIYPYVNLNMEEEPLIDKIRMRILRILTSLSIRVSSLVIYISDFSLELILRQERSERSRNIRIYLGVAPEFFREQKADAEDGNFNYILSVSSVSKRKNYAVLMKAYNKLRQDIQKKYKIILAGDVTDELKTYLLGLIDNHELRNRVIFKGKVSFEELCKLYKKASLFVLPSLVEGFGIPVVEAMAAGIPVLVANATSLPEIVGDAGLKFDPYNAQQFSQVIEKVLSDNELASKMSHRGVERAKLFTWDRTAKETLDCFSRLKGAK